MSKPPDETTEWLSANMPAYENILIHAIFRDPQHRADFLDRLGLKPADFRRVEDALVVGGLMHLQNTMRHIGHGEPPSPPSPAIMQTFVHLAAKEELCSEEEIGAAMKRVEELQNPTLKDQHHMVKPCLEAWIGTVRGKKLARELQMGKIADVRPFLDELGDVIASAREIVDPVGRREFDYDNPPATPESILMLGGYTICTPGNISNIHGPPKAAKSAAVGAVLSACLLEPGLDADTLGFTAGNPGGRAVIHVDTEQSAHDHDGLVRRAHSRAKRSTRAAWLHSYYLTGMEPTGCWDYLVRVVRKAAVDHDGVRLIVVDGIADFCSDPNDAKECFKLVQKLHRLALDYQCAILTVLHENPGSAAGKTRGHLGSQLDQKAETSLRLFKDEKTGTVCMWVERGRHCFMPKSSGMQFRWCDESKMQVSLCEDDECYIRPKPGKLDGADVGARSKQMRSSRLAGKTRGPSGHPMFHASRALTTLPWTSVKRKSLP